MTTLVTILHVLVSIVLILVILLQAGKGGGMGAAFGGGAGSVFGGRGATTFLSKVTSACAAVFMVTSLTLSYLATRSQSVVRSEGAPVKQQQSEQVPNGMPPPVGGAPVGAGQQAPAAPQQAPAQQPAAPAPAK